MTSIIKYLVIKFVLSIVNRLDVLLVNVCARHVLHSLLSELITHTILDLGLIVLNLALSTTTVILFTECCLQTVLTFLCHCKCPSFIFSLIYMF